MKLRQTTANKTLTRTSAERISAIEGLHMSEVMRAKFAKFDAEGTSGKERRAQLLAHYKLSSPGKE